MAKKRKLNSKLAEPRQTQQQVKEEPQEQHVEEEEQHQQQHVEEEHHQQQQVKEEENQEDGGTQEFEQEVEGVVEEEEDEEDDGDSDNSDDDEAVQKILEPFSKEQLIDLLSEAADRYADVAARIRIVADEDPAHRKIFVHGLGWDANAETLTDAFKQYGEIEDCRVVTDKVSGKSKGYGFVLFRSRSGARKALKEPQKKIGIRMTACQLASVGPVPSAATVAATVVPAQPVSEHTQRKIYVSNVGAELDPQKLTTFFAKYGEIEDGPLGLDKHTGKPKGFCLFVYKSMDSAKKALEEPHKNFEGHILHCQKAIDGPKQNKIHPYQRKQGTQNAQHPSFIGNARGSGLGNLGPAMTGGIPFNQEASATQALNPALGQALTAFLATQGAGLGLNNLLGPLGAAGVGGVVNPTMPSTTGIHGGYGNQGVGGVVGPGVMGGFVNQGGYSNQQMGQGGHGRTQHGVGYMGGMGH